MKMSFNAMGLQLLQNYGNSTKVQAGAIERISSGLKINNSGDDPVGHSRGAKMQMQLRSLQKASNNAQTGVNLISTADQGAQAIMHSVQRMDELILGMDDLKGEEDKQAILNEIEELAQGIDNIAKHTDFNNVNLLNAEDDSEKILIGITSDDVVNIPTFNLTYEGLELNEIIDAIKADDLDKAIEEVRRVNNQVRGALVEFGAYANRLDNAFDNTQKILEQYVSAESTAMDADIAKEAMELAKGEILMQTSSSLMAQSNQFTQDVLQILNNIYK